jgi:hypothetical protein
VKPWSYKFCDFDYLSDIGKYGVFSRKTIEGESDVYKNIQIVVFCNSSRHAIRSGCLRPIRYTDPCSGTHLGPGTHLGSGGHLSPGSHFGPGSHPGPDRHFGSGGPNGHHSPDGWA